MPRNAAQPNETAGNESVDQLKHTDKTVEKIENLNRMLGAVLNYLSDDEIEEIDIESLLDNTEGLRQWWNEYRESNRKHIEEEIKNSLGELTLKDLEMIREQIKEKQN